MRLESIISKKTLPGLITGFFVDRVGACLVEESHGNLATKISQVTSLVNQVYETVGDRELKGVFIKGEKCSLYATIFEKGICGLLLEPQAGLEKAESLLSEMIQSITEAPLKAVVGYPKEVLTEIEKMAKEFLKDFAETVFMVQMKQCQVDKENPPKEQIEKFVLGLEKAGGMIIGPSLAKEMVEKIRKELGKYKI
ncbi:MAG: hypothetical protein AB1393_11050 [Candidatus Edwardsbacteria bacterium]